MLPMFFTNDVAVTAGTVVGVNDNVQEIRSADGSVDRRGAFFSGVQGALTLRGTTAKGDTYSVLVDGRGQYLTRFDGQGSEFGGAAGLTALGRKMLGKRAYVEMQVLTRITQATASRAQDLTVFQNTANLVEGTTFTQTDATLALGGELSPTVRLVATAGITLTTVVDAPVLPLADGLELDRRGVDGIIPSGKLAFYKQYNERNTGDISATYRLIMAPYSLDTFSVPPRAAGPQKTDQVIVDVGWLHQLSVPWSSQSRLGVSVASPLTFDQERNLVVLPVASQAFSYLDERFSFTGGASFTYSALVPRLGTGPVLSLNATANGTPFVRRELKKLVIALNGTAGYSTISSPATSVSSTLLAVGATIEARYPLTKVLGVHAGYDFLYANSSATGFEATNTIRNTIFVGITVFATTDGTISPLQSRVLPR